MPREMRIAICERPGHLAVRTRPIPPTGEGQVLVKVRVCGVCGSDLAAWRGTIDKEYPYSPGHEFCGTVERVGPNVGDAVPGTRVVVNPNLGCGECRYCRSGRSNLCDRLKTRPIKSNGGFGEYVALDHRMVFPLPNGFPDELAPFIEPLSCAMHAARTADVRSEERVAVFGAGVMGVLTAILLRDPSTGSGSRPESIEGRDNCRQLVVVEPDPRRRETISRLLEVSTCSPEELPDSVPDGGFGVAVDCSGRAAAVAQAIRVLGKAGRLTMAGMVSDAAEGGLPLLDVTTKELAIRGAWLNPVPFERAIQAALRHQPLLARLKTAFFRLEEIVSAFESAAEAEVHRACVRF